MHVSQFSLVVILPKPLQACVSAVKMDILTCIHFFSSTLPTPKWLLDKMGIYLLGASMFYLMYTMIIGLCDFNELRLSYNLPRTSLFLHFQLRSSTKASMQCHGLLLLLLILYTSFFTIKDLKKDWSLEYINSSGMPLIKPSLLI